MQVLTKQIEIIKADGTKEFFSRDKLDESLVRAGASSELREKIITHVESELASGMTTTEIYRHAFRLLAVSEKPLAMRYSLRRALVGFGPTGFPFEDYVGEIYKALGFEVEVGKILQGHCVAHEVDLIAYNGEKLIMGEVKFHNELGLKTDLKVILYVKARVDDLKEMEFFYGNKYQKVTEGALITNAKFTDNAIKYGTCQGITMLGWNYPQKGNLQDVIEAHGLHPLSCLSSLPLSHKRELYDRGVVLCKSLRDESLVSLLRLSDEQQRSVKEELALLC